jgi:hypothetical protein
MDYTATDYTDYTATDNAATDYTDLNHGRR